MLIALLAPAPAIAQVEDAAAALAKARRLLGKARDRAALDTLVASLKHGGHARGITARLHLWVGVARYNLGKRKAARRALRIALELDRKLTLPDDVSPKITALLDEIRATLPPPAAPKRDEPAATVKPPPDKGRFGFTVGARSKPATNADDDDS
ncbi:MAG: hypothetical protein KC503_16230, partial [Myxococcales bacterium]|nr:hypothetical protein [Myxococcales bacterium]